MAITALGGNPVNTVGDLPEVGSKAPHWDMVDSSLAPLSAGELGGKRVVLNIFPSVDTGVCAASVKKFNEAAAGLENTQSSASRATSRSPRPASAAPRASRT